METLSEKIKWLFTRCKASVSIESNPHRDFYDTIESYLEDEIESGDIDKDVLSEIIKRDSLIIIMAYPDSPIGSYACYHYDLDKCLDAMISTIKQ